ncbi:MAG TPA: TPM domain-containing protein [Bacteroidota bacterium]
MARNLLPRAGSALFALLCLLAPLRAAAGETVVPYLTGRVVDEAGILSPATVASLEAMLKAHEDSSSDQVVVLTIPALSDGETIEQFSIRVAEEWRIGRAGKDNGVLLIVARDDRKVRIEVGRGLEGVLPDITCGSIIRHEIIPRFKDGDFDGGVTEGTRSILGSIRGAYTADTSWESPDGGVDLAGLIIGGSIFLVVVGTFTLIGILMPGCASWFLYAFLIPFWAAFPMALLGGTAGLTLLIIYLVGFPLTKLLLPRTPLGKRLPKLGTWTRGGTAAWSSSSSGSGSGWSSSGGSSSFSGGGGGFSGGGASGGW